MDRAGHRRLQAWAWARSQGTFTPVPRERDRAQERKNKRAGFRRRWRRFKATHVGPTAYYRRLARHLYFRSLR